MLTWANTMKFWTSLACALIHRNDPNDHPWWAVTLSIMAMHSPWSQLHCHVIIVFCKIRLPLDRIKLHAFPAIEGCQTPWTHSYNSIQSMHVHVALKWKLVESFIQYKAQYHAPDCPSHHNIFNADTPRNTQCHILTVHMQKPSHHFLHCSCII